MVEKPILFNTEMVRAILEGRKTVTRRVVKFLENRTAKSPYCPGDVLWVRETWGDYREKGLDGERGYFYLYRADYPDGATSIPLPESERTDYADSWDLPKWHPSIHMPKEAARIWLRVTNVRVERVQKITRDEAIDDGCNAAIPILEFKAIWDSTIKPVDRDRYGWEANPWVWVIAFERAERPVSGQ